MANEGFNPDDLREYEERLGKVLDLQNRATDGLKGYNSILKEINGVARNLKTIKKEEGKLLKEIESREIKRKLLIAKAGNLLGKNKELVEAQVVALNKEIAARQTGLNLAKKKTEELQKSAKIMAESVNSANLLSASFVSLGKGIVGGLRSLKDVSKELIKEQKAVYLTEQSMGVLSKSSNAFRMNMYKAAGSTQQLGVGVGDLAKMQGAYSEQVGRSVQLSQQGLVAMAEMSKGTMMGAEGAAEMAAGMDSFGVSVVGARDIVEDMMNLSSKMGVNSVKVTANLKKNMQLANRFHFKDGVKGMVRLAASAAKVKVNMDGIATMADKVFRPEGAIEMSSRLQTMGGDFAKLGDPFQLMFKARNDFEGFTNDIIDASKEFAKFNSETGEFEISGLGLDRIKEISDITGLAADDIAKMSRDASKIDVIEARVGMGITDEDNIDFISSVATFDTATKEYKVMVNGQNTSIKNLKDADVAKLRGEKATLEERAKQAQTFDETWENIKNTFKTLLLPFLEGIGEGLKEPMQDFLAWMNADGGNKMKLLFDSVKDFTQMAVKFITDNPLTTLLVGGGLLLAGKAAQWIANGVSLGIGFNTVASAGGGGGLTDMIPGKKMKGLRNASKIGKFAKGAGGAGAGLLSAGISGYNEWSENSEAGMDTGENVGRTATRAAASGGGAWGGAALGATIGTMVFPGVGTAIGGLIGGIAGGLAGDYVGDKGGDMMFGESKVSGKYDDVIMRSGQAPIGINKDDDVLAAKRGGAVDKAMAGANKSPGGSSHMTFSPITIGGKIEISGSNGSSGEIDLNDPILIRDLSKVIQEEVRKSIGGGKLNPNPL